MEKFSDKGPGWHGQNQRHSDVKNPILRELDRKKREREYLRNKYYGHRRLSKSEIRQLNKRRVAYAKKYREDAVTGIPPGY